MFEIPVSKGIINFLHYFSHTHTQKNVKVGQQGSVCQVEGCVHVWGLTEKEDTSACNTRGNNVIDTVLSLLRCFHWK